jgi:hypothetical protein
MIKRLLLVLALLAAPAWAAFTLGVVGTAAYSSSYVSSYTTTINSVPGGSSIGLLMYCEALYNSSFCGAIPTDSTGCVYRRTGATANGSSEPGAWTGSIWGIFICPNSAGGNITITETMTAGTGQIVLIPFAYTGVPTTKFEFSADHNQKANHLAVNSLDTVVYGHAGDVVINFVAEAKGSSYTTPTGYTIISAAASNSATVYYKILGADGYVTTTNAAAYAQDDLIAGTVVLRGSAAPSQGFQQAYESYQTAAASSNTVTLPDATTAGCLLMAVSTAQTTTCNSQPPTLSDGANTWTNLPITGTNSYPNAWVSTAISTGGHPTLTATWPNATCSRIVIEAEYCGITGFGSTVLPSTYTNGSPFSYSTSTTTTGATGQLVAFFSSDLVTNPFDKLGLVYNSPWIQRRWVGNQVVDPTVLYLFDTTGAAGTYTLNLSPSFSLFGAYANAPIFAQAPFGGSVVPPQTWISQLTPIQPKTKLGYTFNRGE